MSGTEALTIIVLTNPIGNNINIVDDGKGEAWKG